jgi:putative transposon-encoded protein
MKLWKMKKSSDFDHEIKNLVEKNVGTPVGTSAIVHWPI